MDGERPAGEARALAGIWLLSAGMLVFELALTRLLALAQFYHFAFMVVSLALLGMGGAGTLLCLRPAWGRPAPWAIGFAGLALCDLAVLRFLPFDSYAVAWDWREVGTLVITLVATTAPFLCAGLVIGGGLQRAGRRRHLLYAANLVGSAGGCLAALALLAPLGGEGTAVAGAALGLLASACLQGDRGPGRRAGAVLAAIAAGGLLAVAAGRPAWLAVTLSPYKALPQALQAPGARHTVSRWGLGGRIDVVESESIHVLPGLSERAPVERPPLQAGLTVDGDNLVPITALAPDEPAARVLAQHVPEAVVGAVGRGARRLVLDPGGGWSVLTALAGGASEVTVVLRDPTVADVLSRDYGAFGEGLLADPRVRLEVLEPRAYLRRPGRSFDAVVFPLSEGFHPVSSGAYGLAEAYGHTVEAMADAYARLAPDGLLVVTRWLQRPPTESVRALANLVAALERQRVSRPGDHLAAFRSLRTITLVASRSPLDADRLASLRAFTVERGYDLVWLPGLAPHETNRFQRVERPLDAQAFAALLADPAGFVADHPYDVRPTTDDRPFFHHYFRWRQTPEVLAGLGHTWQPFGGSGYLVLVGLLVLAGALAVVLTLGPLTVQRARRGAGGASGPLGQAIAYFGLLGVGYVFVIVPLAQRLVLYLGQPVTALAAVLAAALLFAGLGSATAPRWPLRGALGALAVVAALNPWLIAGLVSLTLTWPMAARAVLAMVALAPLGVLLGVPFAGGLSYFEGRVRDVTPWAWAANGSASVVAGVLSAMVALRGGFTAAMLCGALAYGCALAVAMRARVSAPRG